MSMLGTERRTVVPMGEETKAIGMSGEKSECLHSTIEAGEPPRGTRWREGEHRVTEPVEGDEAGRPGPNPSYTGLDWVAEMARRHPKEALTTVARYIDLKLLREAYEKTRKDGATGIDGMTWEEYGQNLEGNLEDLRERFMSGKYYAPPVKRVYIPKADGKKKRPIGIPTLEDKVLQRAVSMVLERIYEQEFSESSYGFRPGRGAHQALEAVWQGTMAAKYGGVVIELDIVGFFDNIDHGHLREFLDQRVRDGVIRRAIDKWLKAGVLEEGQVKRSTAGTPQGGVISPLLANIYLHYVLDKWFEEEVQPRLRAPSKLVRYADDAVIILWDPTDAQRVREVLPKRFEKYGLTLHPEKTRVVPFGKPEAGKDRGGKGRGGPGTFTFLGMTHFWGKSRKGQPTVRQKTAKTAFQRVVKAIGTWLHSVRHWKIRDQHRALSRKLKGHDGYYGVTGNISALSRLRQYIRRCWRSALDSRSQRGRMTWARFHNLLKTYPLPRARLPHSIFRIAASP